MPEKKYTLKDLYIGMMAKAEQLSEMYNKYMILLFDDTESKIGKLVFCGYVQNQEYDSWTLGGKYYIDGICEWGGLTCSGLKQGGAKWQGQ